MRQMSSRWLLAGCLVLLAACAAPSGDRDRTVWLVHATDPHLFYGDSYYRGKDDLRRYQEKLNREAFEAFLRGLAALPRVDPSRSYLVISGDFGIDRFGAEAPAAKPAAAPASTSAAAAASPTPAATPLPATTPAPASSTAAATASGGEQAAPAAASSPAPAATSPSTADGPSASRAAAVAYLGDQLAGSPIKTIFFVPGNNDVAGEAAAGPAVDAAAAFFADVQKAIDAKGTGVVLQDLTACYRGGRASSAGCFADVDGTAFRLIGLPSYSFKNVSDDGKEKRALTAGLADQAGQLRQLESMVTQAAAARKAVLVVTHIPELDDPWALAVKQYQGQPPSAAVRVPNQPAWADTTQWNLDADTLGRWRAIVDSPAVAGVLAGHFHDPHREIYQPPYGWAPAAAGRADLDKLYVAPPLSMRFQDASPIQARGFALFALHDREAKRRVAWWEPTTGTFALERAAEQGRARRRTSLAEAAAWLWELPLRKPDLARAAVIAIALLSAFLTVVAVWQIPPPSTAGTRVVAEGGGAAGAAESANTVVAVTTVTKDAAPLQLSGNFARTVIAGLGGLALVSMFDSLWTVGDFDEKPYYLVLFVVFFVVGLLLSGIVRAANEALRSRVSIARRPVLPRERDSAAGLLAYLLRRIWAWLLSWRSALLVFADTFLNVIQGKNVLQTAVFEQEIADLHESLVRSVDVIREEVDEGVEKAIAKVRAAEIPAAPRPEAGEVRTAIGLLSWDESSLFYVSRERGSLPRAFGRRAMATFSATTGLPRWWRKQWSGKSILLIGAKEHPAFPERVVLDQFFEYRAPADYEAFVILPVPWALRGGDGDARRGVILISFRKEADLDRLWSGLDLVPGGDNQPSTYPDWRQMLTTGPATELHVKDEDLSRTLVRSVRLLAELLRKFNDTLFEDFVRPRHQP